MYIYIYIYNIYLSLYVYTHMSRRIFVKPLTLFISLDFRICDQILKPK